MKADDYYIFTLYELKAYDNFEKKCFKWLLEHNKQFQFLRTDAIESEETGKYFAKIIGIYTDGNEEIFYETDDEYDEPIEAKIEILCEAAGVEKHLNKKHGMIYSIRKEK